MKFIQLAERALRTIGAIGQGVPMSPNDLDVAFDAANDMIDAWAAKRLTIFQVLRIVTPIVADQGGPNNPYTLGPGGDINVAIRPRAIQNAQLLVSTTDPAFEYPLDILEPDEYARISIKDLSSAMATSLFFDGKFDTSGADVALGQLFLYPVPNGQLPMSLVLYLPTPMRGFADKETTDYSFPPGYVEALRYQLAKRLAVEFQKPWSADNETLASSTFAVIQRPNAPIPNLRADWGLPGTGAADGLYNWRTGTTNPRGTVS